MPSDPTERSRIVLALSQSGGDVGRAAKFLGASRRTLQNRMREHGLPRGRAGRRKRLLPYATRAGKHRGGRWLLAAGAAVAGLVAGGAVAGGRARA